MSVYRKIDDYFLRENGLQGSRGRCYDHRARVRIPAKIGFTLGKDSWLLATSSSTNILLLLFPVALVRHVLYPPGATDFWLNYVVLFGAFGLFRYGSEELSIPGLRRLGVLWDVTIGVLSLDFEIMIIALCYGHVEIAKAYIVGKVASTTLLTLGFCFSLAGIRQARIRFDEPVATTLASLLTTSIVPYAVLILAPSRPDDHGDSKPVLTFSRAASFVLLGLFLTYHRFRKDYPHLLATTSREIPYSAFLTLGLSKPSTAAPRTGQLSAHAAFGGMLAAGTVAYFCSLPILSTPEVRLVPHKIFTGFCLLPILAEVAELSRIIQLVGTNRTADAIVAATNTSIQTTLCIAPILCLLGWILDQPMSLNLKSLELISFGASTWVFSYLIRSGECTWLEGIMSISLYIVQVLAFYLYG